MCIYIYIQYICVIETHFAMLCYNLESIVKNDEYLTHIHMCIYIHIHICTLLSIIISPAFGFVLKMECPQVTISISTEMV